MGKLHLIKLCVGVSSVDDLISWRKRHPERANQHVTRMWPKRADELLDGGSLYWVIRGVIRLRQPILRLDEVFGQDGIRRCGIVMDPTMIRTAPAPRRAFQGWRYLAASDAPPDIGPVSSSDEALPPELEEALADIGVRV